MQFRFTGQFRELEEFAERIGRAPNVMKRVSEQCAEETIELIREGWDQHRDPYGKPWPAPKLTDNNPLEVHGHLKGGWFKRQVDAGRFTVANARDYAAKLQRGTGLYGPNKQRIYPVRARALRLPNGMFVRSIKGLKPRRMVPNSGRLPERWRLRLVATAQQTLLEAFR
jgi:hypothetical protein